MNHQTGSACLERMAQKGDFFYCEEKFSTAEVIFWKTLKVPFLKEVIHIENLDKGSAWVYKNSQDKALVDIKPNCLKSKELPIFADSFLDILNFLVSNQLSPTLTLVDFFWNGSGVLLGNQHRWYQKNNTNDLSVTKMMGELLYQFYTRKSSAGTLKPPYEYVPKLKKSVSDLTLSLLNGTYIPQKNRTVQKPVEPVWPSKLFVSKELKVIEEIGETGKKGCASLECLRRWCEAQNVLLFHAWDAEPKPYSLINQLINILKGLDLCRLNPPVPAISPWTQQEQIHEDWREYIEAIQEPFLQRYRGALFYFEDVEQAHPTDLDSLRALSFWLRDFPAIMCFRVTHSYSPAIRSLKSTLPYQTWERFGLSQQPLIWENLLPEEQQILAATSFIHRNIDLKDWSKKWTFDDPTVHLKNLKNWGLLDDYHLPNRVRKSIQSNLSNAVKQEILEDLKSMPSTDPLDLLVINYQLKQNFEEDLKQFIKKSLATWTFEGLQFVPQTLYKDSSWDVFRLLRGQMCPSNKKYSLWQKANRFLNKGKWQNAKRIFKNLHKNRVYPPNLRLFFKANYFILSEITNDSLSLAILRDEHKNKFKSDIQNRIWTQLTDFSANACQLNPFIAAWQDIKRASLDNQKFPSVVKHLAGQNEWKKLPWFQEHHQLIALQNYLANGFLGDAQEVKNDFDKHLDKKNWTTFELLQTLVLTIQGQCPKQKLLQIKTLAKCKTHQTIQLAIENLWAVKQKCTGPLADSGWIGIDQELAKLQAILKSPRRDVVSSWVIEFMNLRGFRRCLHLSALISWLQEGVLPAEWISRNMVLKVIRSHGFQTDLNKLLPEVRSEKKASPEVNFLNHLNRERVLFLPLEKRYNKVMELANHSFPGPFGLSTQSKTIPLTPLPGNREIQDLDMTHAGINLQNGEWFWIYHSQNHLGWSFWAKSLNPERQLLSIWQILAEFMIEFHAQKTVCLHQESTPEYGMIGSSKPMKMVRQQIKTWGPSPLNLHIFGESGTGKELVARAIHQISNRPKQLFRAINCSEIPSNLMESTLFGHSKGSFTSAHSDRIGLLETLNGGTLFLDEIGDLDLRTQSLLLRVVQEGEFCRVGEHKVRKTNVRLISATHKELPVLIKKGQFRQDLFYRIAEEVIAIPNLCQRFEDLPALCHFFARKHNAMAPSFSGCFFEKLRHHNWSGNIRELETYIKRVMIKAGQKREITSKDCVPHLLGPIDEPTPDSGLPLLVLESNFRKIALMKRLNQFGWNKTRAARSLGISRQRLVFLTKRFALAEPDQI